MSARFRHPHIVSVVKFGHTGPGIYLRTQLVCFNPVARRNLRAADLAWHMVVHVTSDRYGHILSNDLWPDGAACVDRVMLTCRIYTQEVLVGEKRRYKLLNNDHYCNHRTKELRPLWSPKDAIAIESMPTSSP